METHARYFLIGLFSLIVTVLLAFVVLWLGKLQIDREYQEYDVRFHESVAGLSMGGIVQYQGIQIGEVRKLSLDPKDPREVIARVRVAADTPIKTDTRAQLSYTGLTGVAVIELIGGTPEARLLREADTRARPQIESIPSTLNILMKGSSGAILSAQEVLVRIGAVLSDENVAHVSQVLANLETLSTDIRSDYPALRAGLEEARALERRLSSAAVRLDDLLAQAQAGIAAKPGDPAGSVFDQTRAAVSEVRTAAAAFEQFSVSADSAARGIDDQARQELAATLHALRLASENLTRITRNFNESPLDYVRGAEELPVYHPEPKTP